MMRARRPLNKKWAQAALKFPYSEKATKVCEIFPLLLTVCTAVKSKGKISQNFVAFLEYMNFSVLYKKMCDGNLNAWIWPDQGVNCLNNCLMTAFQPEDYCKVDF